MESSKLAIIIASAVGGTLVLASVVALTVFLCKRSQKKVRVFSLRAATPLDDAVFQSWRRPSEYSQRPEKYGIRTVEPAVIKTSNTPNMFEKELGNYRTALARIPIPPHVSDPIKSPTASVKKPNRAHRKSSCASSLADRPPTPYSPVSSEYPRSSFAASRKSCASAARSHYPSMSEASQFDFDFNNDFSTDFAAQLRNSNPDVSPDRPSIQSTRPLNFSYNSHAYDQSLRFGIHPDVATSRPCTAQLAQLRLEQQQQQQDRQFTS